MLRGAAILEERMAARRDSCDLAAYADYLTAVVNDTSDHDRHRELLEPLIAEADAL